MKKKAIIIVVAIIAALVLLNPTTLHFTDGGTVKYQAILYSVTNYHRIKTPIENDIGIRYDTGIEIAVLGKTVYENTTFDK